MNPMSESKEERPKVASGSKSRNLLEPMYVSMQDYYHHMGGLCSIHRTQNRQNTQKMGGSIISDLSKLRTNIQISLYPSKTEK